MGFFDEFKRLAHPYPDEEEEDYGDGFDTQPRSSERRDRDRSRDRASRSDASFYSDSGADDFSGRRGNKKPPQTKRGIVFHATLIFQAAFFL